MNLQARLAGAVENDAVDGACSAASKCHRMVASKPERFKEVRPGNDDGVPKFWRNWRGHDDVMQTRSIRGSGVTRLGHRIFECVFTIGTRSAQSIMASAGVPQIDMPAKAVDRRHPKKQRRRRPKSDADAHSQASGYEIRFREPHW